MPTLKIREWSGIAAGATTDAFRGTTTGGVGGTIRWPIDVHQQIHELL